jgi:hypothetical protein
MNNEIEAINRWTDTANSVLLNRKIVNVRYLTDDEMDAFGWRYKCIVLTLDDNTLVFPSRDDEGNDAGALHYLPEHNGAGVIPVI